MLGQLIIIPYHTCSINQVCDVWILPEEDRWRLYRRWAYDARENCYEVISDFEEIFDGKANELQDLRNEEDLQILRKKDVIGMTTTGNCSTELLTV